MEANEKTGRIRNKNWKSTIVAVRNKTASQQLWLCECGVNRYQMVLEYRKLEFRDINDMLLNIFQTVISSDGRTVGQGIIAPPPFKKKNWYTYVI